MQPTNVPPPPLWVSFVPLLVLAIPFLVMTLFLARRKGENMAQYLILALIPGINVLATLWLASKTDAAVKAEILELRRRLDGNA